MLMGRGYENEMLGRIAFRSERLCDILPPTTSINMQIVRWRRKPRWLPVAKSKQFRFPERKSQDPDEKIELLHLHNVYRTQLRSVVSYLHTEADVQRRTSTADHLVLTPGQEQAEFQKCLEINVSWNDKVAREKDIRLQREAQERKAYVAKKLDEASWRVEERQARLEVMVSLEKERSKAFITMENLDENIKQALASPVDYNFAIDLQGNMFKGKHATPNMPVRDSEEVPS